MKKNISFVAFLRACGAIIVLLAHLLFMFWNGGTEGIWEFLNNGTPIIGRYVPTLCTYLYRLNLNAGSIGVAFFFLITGFLIAPSIRKYKKPEWFLAAKLLRLYPMYIIGFSITFGVIYIYTTIYRGVRFPYSFSDWLEQISLIRSFLWKQSIDEISWTLVADVEFYVLVVLLIVLKKTGMKGWLAASSMLTAVSVMFSLFEETLLNGNHIFLFQLGNHIALGAVCLTYMLIGALLFEYYSGSVNKSKIIAALSFSWASFILSCLSYRDDAKTLITSYAFSLVVFVICMILEKENESNTIFNNRIMMFFSKISFPLFIIHGLNGYIIETVLFQKGDQL